MIRVEHARGNRWRCTPADKRILPFYVRAHSIEQAIEIATLILGGAA